MNKKKKVVIVGGGYLGSMAGLLFSTSEKFDVVLVEKQSKLGGLYSSSWTTQSPDGSELSFDFGSRAILATGVEDLDNLLFSLLPDDEYPKSTTNLKEFSYQAGAYRNYSNCLDARLLPQDLYIKGREEMLALSDPGLSVAEFASLKDYCAAAYGPTFSESLVRPAIEKLTGLTLEELDPIALEIHGIQRIIIGDNDEAITLKQESAFNGERIAFARYDDHQSDLLKTYPRTLGMSDFGRRIGTYLDQLDNIQLMMGVGVAELQYEEQNISVVILEDGQKIETDILLWTLPAAFLAKILGNDLSKVPMPVHRNTVLAHYVVKGSLLADAYFVYNYDKAFSTYRSTFYNNFSDRSDDYLSMTIEVFVDTWQPDLEAMNKLIFDEQKSMKLISQDSAITDSHIVFAPRSWPNFATGFFDLQDQGNAQILNGLENTYLVGKANGKHHSASLARAMNEVFLHLDQN